jgi:hypothetical protein
MSLFWPPSHKIYDGLRRWLPGHHLPRLCISRSVPGRQDRRLQGRRHLLKWPRCIASSRLLQQNRPSADSCTTAQLAIRLSRRRARAGKTPLTNKRLSFAVRPGSDFLPRNISAIRAHCWSLSSCRFAMHRAPNQLIRTAMDQNRSPL